MSWRFSGKRKTSSSSGPTSGYSLDKRPTCGWSSRPVRRRIGGASSLTAAELRLLPLLCTHLTLKEISERLYLSRNTVKTQSASVYRKFGVNSRSEAVDRMHQLGLLTRPSDFG